MIKQVDDGGQIFEDMQIFADLWSREFPGSDPQLFALIGSVLRLATMLENEFRAYTQSAYAMGTGDMRVLLALRRAGPPFAMRPTDLFQSLLITSGAVTKQVERLTQRGLVERVPDPNRKRSWQIHLTSAGKEMTDSALEEINSRFGIGVAFHKIPVKDRKAGIAFLARMIAEFSQKNRLDARE